ncbi:MAG: site-2 protease family protein [Candidatus Thiodiazotropha sp.]
MIDLLLMASTIALLILAQLLRIILALRLPESVHFKPITLDQPPDVMQDLLDQADQALTGLGFTTRYWATVHSKPALPGMIPPLARLYHHPERAVIARVTPPYSVFSTDRCQIVFLSISQDKRLLATANRAIELFPRPPETQVIMLNTQVEDPAKQFQAHCEAMQHHAVAWRDEASSQGDKHWTFKVANYYEKKSIQWYLNNHLIKQQEDGSATPTLWVALRFLGRFFTGRERNPPRETSPIPIERAAYLFQNWQLGQSLPLPVATQLGIFVLSSIAFIVLAGIFWDWQIGLLLLGVILFHEFGHWLAMRLLGYRNLQILMLPLVGGVTLGQETSHKVSHRAIVSLMGPLPGIIAGTMLLALNGMRGEILPLLGILLLVVNYLNLLPFMPLDGGQLLRTLIPYERLGLMVALDWLGVAGLILLGWLIDSLFISILALIPLFSSLSLMKTSESSIS